MRYATHFGYATTDEDHLKTIIACGCEVLNSDIRSVVNFLTSFSILQVMMVL